MDQAVGPVNATEHRGDDDLLSAGLGLAGLRGPPATFADPAAPTPAELRRRAIQTAWKAIADLGPLGGYGTIYGAVPNVPGREFHAFARLLRARTSHRVLTQVPDHFDTSKRCLIVTASSGSRGIYGAIAVAGAWGLANGCAVAHTDKGTGAGYFDCRDESGVALDGTRAHVGDAELEFVPDVYTSTCGIAIKHAHSKDNPEADWGEHLLQAAQFGLAMLDRALPQHAPFTHANTRIVAVGLSNGGTAALQAAGLDDKAWLAGVVAIEPNIYAPAGPGARALYEYACEAAQWMPAALLDARFDTRLFAQLPGSTTPAWRERVESLRADGRIAGAPLATQSAQALAYLHERGWNEAVLATAVSSTAFDLWRFLAVTYASAYARTGVDEMVAGFRFATLDAAGEPRLPTQAERAAWWSDAGGIAPGNGVSIVDPYDRDRSVRPVPDRSLSGVAALASLWSDETPLASRLRVSVAATAPRLPRADLPIFIVHGAEDGLIPPMFSSAPYVAWLSSNGCDPTYWLIPHAQHFDAFLALPGFGDRYVPMLAYAYAAIGRMVAQVTSGDGAQRASPPVPKPTARGARALERTNLDLSGIA